MGGVHACVCVGCMCVCGGACVCAGCVRVACVHVWHVLRLRVPTLAHPATQMVVALGAPHQVFVPPPVSFGQVAHSFTSHNAQAAKTATTVECKFVSMRDSSDTKIPNFNALTARFTAPPFRNASPQRGRLPRSSTPR